MGNPTLVSAPDITDSAQGKAGAFVPSNQRVSSGNMPLSVQSDVPTFPGSSPALTVTGTWMMAGTRVTASGVAVVSTASVGVGYTATGASSGPLQIVPGNSHVLIAF